MEIKVQCDCGQKFKFDVEPVSGRMPFAVKCPVCGLDGTPRANVVLQQQLSQIPTAPAASAPVPAPMPISIAPSHAAPPSPMSPPPPAPIRPAGLNINRPSPAQQATPAADVSEDVEGSDDNDESTGGVSEVKLGWKMWGLIILFIVISLVGSYFRGSSKRRSFIGDLISWGLDAVNNKKASGASEADTAKSEASSKPSAENVLPDDNGVMLLVKSSDASVVAQACADIWGQSQKKKLFCVATPYPTGANEKSAFNVLPAHDGFVEIDGSISWEDADVPPLTGLSEQLSKKLSATVVCALMGDDADSGIVVIHENGERKFSVNHSLRFVNGDIEDVYRVTGEAWASSAGFKPGEKGYKEFTMEDAERLVRKIGFNSDSHTIPTNCIVIGDSPQKH